MHRWLACACAAQRLPGIDARASRRWLLEQASLQDLGIPVVLCMLQIDQRYPTASAMIYSTGQRVCVYERSLAPLDIAADTVTRMYLPATAADVHPTYSRTSMAVLV